VWVAGDLQVRSRLLAFRQVLISASSTYRRRCPRVVTSITCSLRLPHVACPPSFRDYRLHSSPNSPAYPLSPTITLKDYRLKFVFIISFHTIGSESMGLYPSFRDYGDSAPLDTRLSSPLHLFYAAGNEGTEWSIVL
jgi:hypothetical protein